MATWGKQPHRDALPGILEGIARSAARAGGQWNRDLFVGVALMPSGWVGITLGMARPPAVPMALAQRVYQGDGKQAWSLISERSSPLLAAAPVPDWLRG